MDHSLSNLEVSLGRRLGRLEVSSDEVKTCLSEVEDRCSTVEKALLLEHQVKEKWDERITELEKKVDMLGQKLEKLLVNEREHNVNAIDAALTKQCVEIDDMFSKMKQKLEKMESEKDSEMNDKDQLREKLAALTKDHMELSLNLLAVVETCQQSEINMMRVEQKNLELVKEVKQLKEGQVLLEDNCCRVSLVGSEDSSDPTLQDSSDAKYDPTFQDSSDAVYDPTLPLVPVAPPPPAGYQLICPPLTSFPTCPSFSWTSPRPPPSPEFNCTCTYVDWDCNLHVSHADNQANLVMIRTILNSKYSFSSPRPTDLYWTAGQDCVARYHLDGMWYRGRVLKVNMDTEVCEVKFVDYGIEDFCNFADMRKDLFSAQFPIQCFTIRMFEIEPRDGIKWEKRDLDFLHDVVVEQELKVKVRMGGSEIFPQTAVSVVMKSGVNIGDLLVNYGFARRIVNSKVDPSTVKSI